VPSPAPLCEANWGQLETSSRHVSSVAAVTRATRKQAELNGTSQLFDAALAAGDAAGGGTGPSAGGSTPAPSKRPPSLAAARALLDTVIGRQSPPSSSGGQP
jgi:hypothetical protein